MPDEARCFTIEADGRLNVLVTPVRISPAFDPRTRRTRPKSTQFLGVWDTGATGSVVSSRAARQCGLKPVGMVLVHHAGGQKMTNVYLVNLYLPMEVAFSQLRVTEGELAGGVDVLVGMDVIGAGDFAVSNLKGKTVFTFRIPSCERIDFLPRKRGGKAPQKVSASKIGRNDPCPCGSGKKYKKCCGK